MAQPWGRILVPPQAPPRWRMVTSGWAQDSWSSALLPQHQPIRKTHAPSGRSWRLGPTPQKTVPLKFFMVEQNLQSWFLNMSSPSLQVAGLLNKVTFLLLSMLVSGVSALEQWAAGPEFGDMPISQCKHSLCLVLLPSLHFCSCWFQGHYLRNANMHLRVCFLGNQPATMNKYI